MSDEQRLLQAWRAGDASAGNELFERHFAAVCRFFRSKLGDDVQDVVQKTFLDCARSRDAIDEALGFRSYLFGIARHRLVDELRRRTRVAEPLESSLIDLGTTPSQAAARNEDASRLREALDRMPLQDRIVFELHYWEGLSCPEIAGAFGVSPHTIRSRLSRGRQALRAHLEHEPNATPNSTDDASGTVASGS